jgi:tRNA A37 threonylcarbamoyltransferase TsaD
VFDKIARALGGPYPGGKWINDYAATYHPSAGETNPFTKPK